MPTAFATPKCPENLLPTEIYLLSNQLYNQSITIMVLQM